MFKNKKVLILEGGGFKTSFSAGVMDAFQMQSHNPFDSYIGVSGGCIAISYFLSKRYGYFYQCMRTLCQDERFVKYSKAFTDGLMNLDFFYDIAYKEFPFDFDQLRVIMIFLDNLPLLGLFAIFFQFTFFDF